MDSIKTESKFFNFFNNITSKNNFFKFVNDVSGKRFLPLRNYSFKKRRKKAKFYFYFPTTSFTQTSLYIQKCTVHNFTYTYIHGIFSQDGQASAMTKKS